MIKFAKETIAETAAIELHTIVKAFGYFVDSYFSTAKEPETFKYSYDELATQLAMYSTALWNTSETLNAAFDMPSEVFTEQLSALLEKGTA